MSASSGRAGVDDYGAWLISILHDKGVDTTHFIADPAAPTMLAIVAAPTPTEQQFILYSGASTLLRPETLPKQSITEADVFVYGGVTLSGGSRDAALQAGRWARNAGRHVVFDVNLRPTLWPDLAEAHMWILAGVATATVVKLNQAELEFLTGFADPAQGSQVLLDQGVRLCCVSLGADGAYFNNGAASGTVGAANVSVVDTTGSGDAFVAGLAHRICQFDQPLQDVSVEKMTDIVNFANACGGLAAAQRGAMCDLRTEVVASLMSAS